MDDKVLNAVLADLVSVVAVPVVAIRATHIAMFTIVNP